jgi:MFS family permease
MNQRLRSMLNFDPSVRLIFLVNLLVGIVYFGITLLLNNLYVASLNFDTVFIGNLNGMGLLAFTLAAVPAGLVGARMGLRGTTAAGYTLGAAGMALFLLTTRLPAAWWQPWMIASQLVGFIGGSIFIVNSTPYLMNIAPEDQRKRAFTFAGTALAVGALLGNLLGGFLPDFLIQAGSGAISQSTAYNWVMWLIVVGYLGAAAMMMKARPVPPVMRKIARAAREKAPAGLLGFMGILFIVQMFSEGSIITFMNLYFAQELGISNSLMGSVFAAGQPLTILCTPLLLLLMKRLGAGRTMTWAYVVMGSSALLLALFGQPVIAIAVTILRAPLANYAGTARNLFGQEAVSPPWRTLASAVASISWSLGTGVAALLGGRIIAASGYRGLFFLSAAAAVASVLMYVMYERMRVRPPVSRMEAPVG